MKLEKMNLTKDAEYILDKLNAAGYRADIVGGAVRDHILGRPSFDYDMTTSATPDEVKAVFEGERIIDTGIKHGTVTLMKNGVGYEITTWRVDGDYKDNRHPDSVTYTASLDEDLKRRDFTVNAIAYNPRDGFTDLFGGIEDIEAGVLRAVGDAGKRFDEDALRIMRGVRFAAQLGFSLEEKTAIAARERRGLLANVSEERIYTELKKLISADYAHSAILENPEIILTVLPELDAVSLPDEERFFGVSYTERIVSMFILGASEPLAAFSTAMKRLKTDTAHRVLGENLISALKDYKLGERFDALLLLRDHGTKVAELRCALSYMLGFDDGAERAVLDEAIASGIPTSLAGLEIGGKDIIALGQNGMKIGGLLNTALLMVMKGELPNEREALLAEMSARCRK